MNLLAFADVSANLEVTNGPIFRFEQLLLIQIDLGSVVKHRLDVSLRVFVMDGSQIAHVF